MENWSRPLDIGELHRLRWLLGGGVALSSIGCSLLLDLNTFAVLIACVPLIVATLVWPRLPSFIPRWIHAASFPATLIGFALDYYLGGDLVSALIRLDLVLLTYRACTYRQRRDDLQLVVLGLFLIVATGVLTATLAFAFYLALFIGLGLGLLLVRTLAENAESSLKQDLSVPSLRDHPPRWIHLLRRTLKGHSWRTLAIWVGLSLGVLPLAAGLFLAIPRFELTNTLFIERLLTRKTMTGFTDTLHFGEVSNIIQDTSVAMRVDIPDRSAVTGELYWRMVVLDEYRDQSFHVSTALLARAFQPATTVGRLSGGVRRSDLPRLQGTFYLEPGVSRYLPLTGPFRRLYFNEAQSLRLSPQLQLIQLNRDPSVMKAYRVEDMLTDPVLADPNYHLQVSGSSLRNAVDFLALPLAETDLRVLDQALEQVRAFGPTATAGQFAQTAGRWIRSRHDYSLSMALPPGSGDPLVRWLVSSEPGHCELFAGSLVILARRAGIPSRIVGGFVGGEWNEDYLIVRNSNAHAWCELFNGSDGWLRSDPTRSEQGESTDGQGQSSQLVESIDTWGSWVDRLRMLWYRRIVNFDRNDQQALVQGAAGGAQRWTGRIRAVAQEAWQFVLAWLRQPWDLRKLGSAGAGLAAIAGCLFLLRRVMRWRRETRGALGNPDDRNRRRAGYWLMRLARQGEEVNRDLRRELEVIRFGPPAQWKDPGAVFRSARRASRAKTRR